MITTISPMLAWMSLIPPRKDAPIVSPERVSRVSIRTSLPCLTVGSLDVLPRMRTLTLRSRATGVRAPTLRLLPRWSVRQGTRSHASIPPSLPHLPEPSSKNASVSLGCPLSMWPKPTVNMWTTIPLTSPPLRCSRRSWATIRRNLLSRVCSPHCNPRPWRTSLTIHRRISNAG